MISFSCHPYVRWARSRRIHSSNGQRLPARQRPLTFSPYALRAVLPFIDRHTMTWMATWRMPERCAEAGRSSYFIASNNRDLRWMPGRHGTFPTGHGMPIGGHMALISSTCSTRSTPVLDMQQVSVELPPGPGRSDKVRRQSIGGPGVRAR